MGVSSAETPGLKTCLVPLPQSMTARKTGALTVAGQWRSFTAFPNILAIAVMSRADARGSGSDGMETTSMTSTFIAGPVSEVNVENLVSKTGTPALKLPHSLASATSVFCWLAEPQLGLVGEGW
jgi:hypothetical protein